MKKELMLIAIGSLLLFSCSKRSTTALTGMKICSPNVEQSGAIGAGEDGDIIIINHKIVGINGAPVSGVHEAVVNGSDTFTCTTNSAGVCVFQIPSLGTWDLYAAHAGYIPLHLQLNIVDLTTTQVDTMLVH